MTNKVVLAYSGGLDTSVAVAWLREQHDAEVVTLTVDVGGTSLREGVERRAMSAGASRAYVVDARETLRPRLLLARPPGERALPGRLPARHRARPAAHRPAPRRGRPEGGCRRGRPRLHRQGQRPGPLRRGRPRPRPGAPGHRPDARRHGPHPRPGDRLRERPRDRDPDHQGLPLLHRRQHVGPLLRDGHPGGSLGRAAGRRLRLDRRPGDRAAGRSRSSSGSRAGSRSPSTASASARSPSSSGSTSSAAHTASGGSTTSRTAWSASRAARSTRRPRPRSSTPRTGRWRASSSPRTPSASTASSPTRSPSSPTTACGSAPSTATCAATWRAPSGRSPATSGSASTTARATANGRRSPALALRQEPGDLRRGRRLRPRERRRLHRDLRAAAAGRGGPPRRGRGPPRGGLDLDTAPPPGPPLDDHRPGDGWIRALTASGERRWLVRATIAPCPSHARSDLPERHASGRRSRRSPPRIASNASRPRPPTSRPRPTPCARFASSRSCTSSPSWPRRPATGTS